LLPKAALKDLLSQSQFNKTDKILIILSVDDGQAKEIKEVKKLAIHAGLRAIQKWNVSSLLARSKGMAVRTAKGWELTAEGSNHITKLCGPLLGSPAPKVAASLRTQLSHITNSDTSNFVEEAIGCYEAKLYRAAVVLSWVGAVAVLYDFVINNRLSDFNAEALRRNPKWKTAKTSDDLARIREHDFLEIIEAISVIGKSVKQELEGCLKLRNGCGHPSSLKLSEHRVAAHIESLILNVFTQFA
jgi:hypothetical protein